MTPSEALTCAKASEVIYGTQQETEAMLGALGFTDFAWIDLQGLFRDVCAVVTTAEDYTLLAFRGTKTPHDFMTDLACTPVRFDWIFSKAPALGEIHAGFGHALSDGLARIFQALTPRDQTKPLIITGHSLGGAFAVLAATCLATMDTGIRPASAIYTFGQPRVGLHNFCGSFERLLSGKLVRFVNQLDLVPRIPFTGWDFGDSPLMIHFDSAGKPVVESDEWKSFIARQFASTLAFLEIITHIGVDVGFHSMSGYRALIEANQTQLAALLPV